MRGMDGRMEVRGNPILTPEFFNTPSIYLDGPLTERVVSKSRIVT